MFAAKIGHFGADKSTLVFSVPLFWKDEKKSWFLNDQKESKQTSIQKSVLKASQGIVEGLYRNIKRVWQWKNTYGCRQAVKRDQNNSVALQWGATERVPWLLTAARNRDWDENEEKNMKGKEKMHACVHRERERDCLEGEGVTWGEQGWLNRNHPS